MGQEQAAKHCRLLFSDAVWNAGVTAKNADAVVQRASAAAVPVVRLGATGGKVLAVAGERPLPVKDLRARFEAWLPAYMAAPA